VIAASADAIGGEGAQLLPAAIVESVVVGT
jgi:hypothetical protein